MDPLSNNRRLWDRWANLHRKTPVYDFDGFLEGGSTLRSVETRELVGKVEGRSLLHLQCHVGLDSLSIARHGAEVTGLDFSPVSIATAERLSEASGIDARFVCADVLDAPQSAGRAFDVVFTSYGVLSWLPDLPAWAQVLHECLRPGGVFYMVENHPIMRILRPRTRDDAGNPVELPYLGGRGPVKVVEFGSYARYDEGEAAAAHYWLHTLGDVVTVLARAGLILRFLHEHPEDRPNETSADEVAFDQEVPALFSLEAVRPMD